MSFPEIVRLNGILNGRKRCGSFMRKEINARFVIEYALKAPNAYSSPRKTMFPENARNMAMIEKTIMVTHGVWNLGCSQSAVFDTSPAQLIE